ncbi:ABC transporter ATP-binding protein [Marinovum algicola]|uniref:Carbohydrate ABC transporter ATP-binding protein, CUT1 family n=1 Tax=Marinovum algicola TaxID=42444 RepID=A0A975WCC4_9RHOB|nr:ABC transporter ATP-binding protein [Marinovum algicola]SEJ89827.1 carbohydrate ABC transporter ATP-binding protein, CUT1 family [Marinovum algicola]SLN45268.1 Trehalose import ATP-binding protein SugC [Marinovum algicola]
MATIDIKSVEKSFGALKVLKSLDIHVQDGELLVLVGPSGCGKSTLLSMIAGLSDVSKGNLLIDGDDVTRSHPRDRDIAMVFQTYALYPTMTVRQNISFGLEMRRVPKAERTRAVEDVAALLQITHLLDRKPSQLSGGQRQRVAMGRALVRDPKVFLLDEPLSNLDAKLRVEMRTEIKKLHERLGKTMIYVTHDQIEAMTLATRIAVMKDGEIQQLDVPRVIYDEPANMFVASFIGSPEINFIPCDVISSAQGVTLQTEGPLSETVDTMGALADAVPGDGVMLGIRPEDVRLVTASDPKRRGEFALPLRIEVIEPTGAEDLVTLSFGERTVQCKMRDAGQWSSGDIVTAAFDLEKTKFFSLSSGDRIVAARQIAA